MLLAPSLPYGFPSASFAMKIRIFGLILLRFFPPAKLSLFVLSQIKILQSNGMDYLLTWNCAHIANAVMRPKVEDIYRGLGYEPSIICTPQELMEG